MKESEGAILGIYKMSMSFRGGDVESIFYASRDDIKEIMGKEIYFGEILGKYSEVQEEMTDDIIKLITEDGEAVNMFIHYDLTTGYNPIEYWAYTKEMMEDEERWQIDQ